MTPQSNFMVVAPIRQGSIDPLRMLLAAMTGLPGMADPANRLFPFGQFTRLHFARFVVLDDLTLGDRALCGLPAGGLPTYLAFLGDCDGPLDDLFDEFVRVGKEGLSQIFAHCETFDPAGDVRDWMRRRSVDPATQYVNWVGRSVEQIRQEASLRAALRRALGDRPAGQSPTEAHRWLRESVRATGPILSPLPPAPLAWRVGEWLHLAGSALPLIVFSPFLVVYAPFFLLQLRSREQSDAVIAPRPAPAHLRALSAIEDHDVSNQFSAFGSVKPGRFRLWTLVFILWAVNLTTRHLYTRGRLARVGTIHFARWVFLDGRRRLFFASNYDGSLNSYMDDFINKVAFGLNLVFSNGIGYPRTDYLVSRGAKDEQGFKFYIRRHQLPTEVWYKAYPGLTATDIALNAEIRQGFDRPALSKEAARRWLALIR
jgi:hypothetical protein